ncbi:RNA 2',3'-cyclic phosphodiesterase [Candidatus Altiarchaeota archaeon]
MRCFIAIEIPDEVKAGLVKVQEDLAGYGRFKMVEYDNLHLTLKFLGEVPEDNIPHINEKLLEISEKSFNMEVRGIGVFPSARNPRIVWAGVRQGSAEVTRLHGIIEDKLAPLGFVKDKRFHPHITIARVKDIDSRPGLSDFIGRCASTSFGGGRVEKIILKQSILRDTGPEYHNIGEIIFKGSI